MLLTELEKKLLSEDSAFFGNGAFDVFFQPQYCNQSLELIAFEALLRWRDKHNKTLAVVQELDSINRLQSVTLFVFQQSVETFNRLNLFSRNISLSVNVPLRALSCPVFFQELQDLINACEHPHLITLELTERDYTDDPKASDRLHELTQAGVKISLDDFGTGFNTFQLLNTFPIDEIKVDKQFVSKSDQQNNDLAIVNSILQLGKNINVVVVLEGVEREGVIDLYNEHTCRLQGYHFSPPVPEESLSDLINNDLNLPKVAILK